MARLEESLAIERPLAEVFPFTKSDGLFHSNHVPDLVHSLTDL
jgi:hypothetical protein